MNFFPLADTPPPPEPPLMVPDRSSPGLFGPRSRSSPIYDRKFLLFIHEV